MAVDAHQLHRARVSRSLNRTAGVAVGEVEAELRVVLAGRDELVRVHVDAWSDTQLHPRCRQSAGDERVDAVEFVETVDDHVAHTSGDRLAQLGDALVVAVHHAARSRHSGCERDEEFSPGRDVEQEALFMRESGHRRAQEGLGRINHRVGAEFAHSLSASRAQVRLVVDEERRAVRRGEVVHVAAADAQPATDDLGGVGQQVSRDGAHICSGDSMPSMRRPSDSTRAVKSHRCRRLSRVASSSAFSTGQCS